MVSPEVKLYTENMITTPNFRIPAPSSLANSAQQTFQHSGHFGSGVQPSFGESGVKKNLNKPLPVKKVNPLRLLSKEDDKRVRKLNTKDNTK